MTLRGVILGALLTVVFTASNVYLGLKAGMTFSSSIPAAVISMALLRMFTRSNILENNMVQTQASAAGAMASIIFILPGLVMLGYWQSFPFTQTLVLCALGGFLGVLFTVPLRRAMVVESDLPYPEGRAAAEILKAGSVSEVNENGAEKDRGQKDIMLGASLSGVFTLASGGFHVFSGGWSSFFVLGGSAVTGVSVAFSTAVLAAGYLIGITSGIAILVGMAIAWGGFVPYFTGAAGALPEGSLADYASGLWASKVRLIGVGEIGIASVWTLVVLAKAVLHGMAETLSFGRSQKARATHHTDQDLSPKAFLTVLAVSVAGLFYVFYDFAAAAGLPVWTTLVFVAAGLLLAVVAGFLVAASCAYMAGLVGSSACPVSGIMILGVLISALTVLGLCTIFHVFDIPGGMKFATAYVVFITSVITAVACFSNDNMQDLKTGHIVGATPWRQQAALLLGCITGALAIAPVLNLLYEAYGFTGAMPRPGMDPSAVLAAPQATLMSTIAQGIFHNSLDWGLILTGVAIGVASIVASEVIKRVKKEWSLPPLAVGFGIYLPASVNAALAIGALIGWVVQRWMKRNATEAGVKKGEHHGVLFASGMIVGESIVGVLIAMVVVFAVSTGGSADPLALVGPDFAPTADVLGFLAFAAVITVFVRCTMRSVKNA